MSRPAEPVCAECGNVGFDPPPGGILLKAGLCSVCQPAPEMFDCPMCGLVEHTGIDDEAHCPCLGGLCECECHGAGL